MKPSTTVKKEDKEKTATSKTSTTGASRIGASSKLSTGTTKTTTTGLRGTGAISGVKKPTISTSSTLKDKSDNQYLSTGGNNIDDALDEITSNKAPSQTPKGAAKFGGPSHMRNTSEIFKGENAVKTAVTKKDGPSPFNANATTTKPFNNPLRQSVKKPTASDNNYLTEKDSNTKEFDLQQSNKKRRISSNAHLGAGYQTTQNSEKNFITTSSNADKDATEALDYAEEINNDLKKASSNASSTISNSTSQQLPAQNSDPNSTSTQAKSSINQDLIEINKSNIASKENEINLMKAFAVEKKQLNDIIHKKNVENEKLKRDYQVLEKNMDQTFKELEDLTNIYNTTVLEKENLESRVLEYCKESDALTFEKNELDDKVSELELELEIKAEELRIANEEFEAYKIEALNAKKQNLDPLSLEFKLVDIENQNKVLTNTLLKLNDEKKHETETLKKQIEDLKHKTKALESISAKDEEIRILKEKNAKYENVIIELKEQINAFSSSAEMLDNMVTEKYDMESEIVDLKEEIKQIKEEFELAEQLNEEYELCIKENNLVIRGKDDEILRLNNHIRIINESIEENEIKQKKILDMYNKSQTDVKILKEELAKNNNNVNVDDFVNANVFNIFINL